jgi:MarR family transcriptional regulator, transcriptional regulator for hemolysin
MAGAAQPMKKDMAITTSSTIRRDISMRLTVIARMLRQDFDKHIADVGVTRSQWSMIVVAARHPGSTQRQIAEYLDMSEASAGRLVDRLCTDGWLERRERDDDRRAREVYLTQAATPILEKLGAIARESEARVFCNFSEDELEGRRAALDKLYTTIAP